MSLREYARKRDFSRTGEPKGNKARTGNHRFVIQKHAASRLHYDFRLEMEGVLRSWAVPKGLPTKAGDRALAVEVEDHPIEYGSFEGVIPEGYGAGIVMLWDSGTWTPESPDVDAALAKGDLKFKIDGYKLKGSWVLVRTRGYSRGGEKSAKPSWLLIKHKDEWSGDLDITEFAPLSVKSGDDFPAIMAAQDPKLWLSNRDAKGGATGVMLREIIEQAAQLKLAELEQPKTRGKRARKPKV